MPVDIVKLFIDYLNLRDLENFRQICRWAERLTSEAFAKGATRQHKSFLDAAQYRPLRDWISVMRGNQHLAAHIGTIQIHFSRYPRSKILQEAWRQAALLAEEQNEEEPTAAALIVALPNLSQLTVVGLNSGEGMLEMHLKPIATPTSTLPWLRLNLLRFETCTLTSGDLRSTLHHAGPRVDSLHLRTVGLKGCSWREMLDYLRSSTFDRLKYVRLEDLYTSKEVPEQDRKVEFRPSNGSKLLRNIFKGNNGFESVELQEENGWNSATMRGTQAVKLGLKLILEDAAHLT